MTNAPHAPGPDALEQLWAGEFGDAYLDRNSAACSARSEFWDDIAARYPAARTLEVGCAHGENLRYLSAHRAAHDLWGLDVNDGALAALRERVPGANAVWGRARELPFRDRYFDLVFTVGLLIHQPESSLPVVMSEIVRCSNRWVMFGEYHADTPTDINYRDNPGVLFKRDYRRLYEELFPGLVLREERHLTLESSGFDRVHFVVFERTGADAT
jgi:pseudaminic acid biosynthesis-associated methylase